MNLATRPTPSLIFLLTIIVSAAIVEGFDDKGSIQGSGFSYKSIRRLMIGSTMPTCTYNECRGCKYRCIAEQVPVEGNDPVNSSYHYRCVCRHRYS